MIFIKKKKKLRFVYSNVIATKNRQTIIIIVINCISMKAHEKKKYLSSHKYKMRFASRSCLQRIFCCCCWMKITFTLLVGYNNRKVLLCCYCRYVSYVSMLLGNPSLLSKSTQHTTSSHNTFLTPSFFSCCCFRPLILQFET